MTCVGIPKNREEAVRKTVSYSQIQTYLTCPQKYFYNYVLKVPIEAQPEALVFGKHIHFAVAEYYRHWQKNGSQMPLEGLQEAFVDGWREEPADIAWKNGNNRESLQERGLAMLETFHQEREQPKEIIAVESRFQVELLDPETGEELDKELVGTVDLVERNETGETVLVELKTSSRAYSPGQIEYSHQPSIYLYGLQQQGLLEEAYETKVRFDVLTRTKTPKFQQLTTTRSNKDIQKTLQLIREVSRAIELEVFYRHNGWQCGDCQFREVCD